MKIDTNLLREIWRDARFVNIDGNVEFDFVNIARIPDQNPVSDRHLFFAVHETDPAAEGWYDEPFDRRTYFPGILRERPHWTFVVEADVVPAGAEVGARLIVVRDIGEAAKKLYEYVIDAVRPKVCAVTGSVGKTTAVSFIEEVIALKHSCLRVYSKRISPLILFCAIINRLEPGTEYVVLEMALWRKEHVGILAGLLPPDIGVMLNIKAVHLHIDGMDSKEDILRSKANILQGGTVPVLNIDDPLIAGLEKRPGTLTCSACREAGADVFLTAVDPAGRRISISVRGRIVTFEPYLMTALTIYELLAACAVACLLGIDPEQLERKLPALAPKENRIGKFYVGGHLVVFDGDMSLDERLDELGNNFYGDTTLILYKLKEQFPLDLRDHLPQIFEKFTRVRILDTPVNDIQLETMDLPANTAFCEHSELMTGLPENSVVFLHYSIYFRDPELSRKHPRHLLEDGKRTVTSDK